MRWTDSLVALATRASHRAAQKRSARALAGYSDVLKLPVISTETIKALGYKKPHNVIRVLNRNKLLEKVRHVPQHWEYRRKEND